MRVHWTHAAIAHLLAIHEHVARDAPIYAQRIVDRLTRRSEQIATFPLSQDVLCRNMVHRTFAKSLNGPIGSSTEFARIA